MYRLQCMGLFDRVLEFLTLDEDLQAFLTDVGKKVDDSRTKEKQQSFINSFINSFTCRTNQLTNFFTIGTSVTKELMRY